MPTGSGFQIIKINFMWPWFMSKRGFKVAFYDMDGYFLKYKLGNHAISVYEYSLDDLIHNFKQQLRLLIKTRKGDKDFILSLEKDFYYGPQILMFEIIVRLSKVIRIMLSPIDIAGIFK